MVILIEKGWIPVKHQTTKTKTAIWHCKHCI